MSIVPSLCPPRTRLPKRAAPVIPTIDGARALVCAVLRLAWRDLASADPDERAVAVRLWRDEASAVAGWCAVAGLPDDARAHVAQTLAGEASGVGAVPWALVPTDIVH